MKSALLTTIMLPTAVLACLNVKPMGQSLSGDMHEETNPARTLRAVMRTSPKDISVRTKFHIYPAVPLTQEARAVELILQGDYPVAKAMLEKLEAETPDDYSTAANLGTLYELTGDNSNALKWITEGMARNPRSHGGTKWLHAHILKAKVNAPAGAGQPFQGRLIDVPDRLGGDTSIMVNGVAHSAAAVRNALQHQLEERLLFVKPKDPYVADLLFSFAVIEANLGTVASAVGLLGMAREYGFPDESLLSRQERRYERTLMLAPIKEKTTLYVTGIVAVVLLFYVTRRVWSLCRP